MPKGKYARKPRAMTMATEPAPQKRAYVRKKKSFVNTTDMPAGTNVTTTELPTFLDEIITFGPAIVEKLRGASMNGCARMIEGWVTDAQALQ
jgi:hypothetical protein